MKRAEMARFTLLAFLLAIQLGTARNLKTVSLPNSLGKSLGAAFSPDSDSVAIISAVLDRGTDAKRHVLQILSLKSGLEVARVDVLDDEAPSLATSPRLLQYSSDGRRLLLATRGSDWLLMFDVSSLKILRRIALHPDADLRKPLGQEHRYFKGVISLAASSKGDVFGVLTHDELQGKEVFLGSFSSGRIVKSWALGKGRTAAQLGQTCMSLSADGSRFVVSVLPGGNNVPRGFDNLRLYNSSTGDLVKSVRTDSLIGQVLLLPGENVLASRIDAPGLLSKRACIEVWSFDLGTRAGQFCDQGRNVIGVLAASVTSDRVVGFASQIHKSIEGQVYAAPGRVDVWDMKSGNIIAYSDELPGLISYLKISATGESVIAGQMFFRLSAATA